MTRVARAAATCAALGQSEMAADGARFVGVDEDEDVFVAVRYPINTGPGY